METEEREENKKSFIHTYLELIDWRINDLRKMGWVESLPLRQFIQSVSIVTPASFFRVCNTCVPLPRVWAFYFKKLRTTFFEPYFLLNS
jgi:hypothetical protein